MVKSCEVGAPVVSLASSPTTSKLAAVTKSSRCAVLSILPRQLIFHWDYKGENAYTVSSVLFT